MNPENNYILKYYDFYGGGRDEIELNTTIVDKQIVDENANIFWDKCEVIKDDKVIDTFYNGVM